MSDPEGRITSLGVAAGAWLMQYIPTAEQAEYGFKLYAMAGAAVLVTVRVVIELRNWRK